MSLNGSNPTTLSHITGLLSPTHFYIDNNGDIYASSYVSHSVFVFRSNSSTGSRVAGNGFLGLTNQQLNEPYGIFVKDVGVIYIADYRNHRIMKWLSGASSGIRVAGDGTPGSKSTQLNSPIDIIVDENEYMYIVEYGNSRVTRWSPNSSSGICIVACSGEAGVRSTQLKEPRSLSFDRSGSLYVSDQGNHRIQKFELLNYPVSNNQPKLIVNAKWSQCAITLIDNNRLSSEAPEQRLNAIIFNCTTLYVTLNGDIYFANGNRTGQIDKITPNSTQSQFVTNFTENCFGLFIDIQNYLYCSMRDKHQVEKILLDGNNQTIMRIAGTGSQGSQSNQLNGPWGIFVDIHFDFETSTTNLFETSEHHELTTTSEYRNNSTSLLFIASSCGNSTKIGLNCDTNGTICDIQSPCLNNGTCHNLNNNQDYNCSCPFGYFGKQCEIDRRICKENTCLNNGKTLSYL
ncbi:hypothetical protein I4U23_022531 [Adineta vaga]|nr:hypothetical protein I4U23_022531 [Adineta vaga]